MHSYDQISKIFPPRRLSTPQAIRQSYFHRYVISQKNIAEFTAQNLPNLPQNLPLSQNLPQISYRKLFGNLNGECIKCLSLEVLRIHPFPCMNLLGREASLRFYAIMSLPNQGSGKRLEYTHWLIDSTKSGEYSYISGVIYRIRRLPLLISGRTSSFFELPPTYAALIPDCLHYSLTYYL